MNVKKEGLQNPDAPMNQDSSVTGLESSTGKLYPTDTSLDTPQEIIEPIEEPVVEGIPAAETTPVEEPVVEEIHVETAVIEEPIVEEVLAETPPAEESEFGEHFVDERHEIIAEAGIDVELPEESDHLQIDYATYSKEQLIQALDEIIHSQAIDKARNDVEVIKVWFYKKHKAENASIRKSFIDDGGKAEDFKPAEDVLENRFKELYKRFKELKSSHDQQLEQIKQENLKIKYQIIEEIKDLINRKESINDTFQEFRNLQNKWRETGIVPQNDLKNLWDTYHHHVEKFYDFIKLNKELRDLDLRKNFEAKIEICEKAEQLILEPSVTKAFKNLQEYHNQWREIGPVPTEKKDELWERFKEATSKINKKHQDYYENLKQDQQNNLDAKTALCEKIDEILSVNIQKPKKWEEKTKELVEIQKLWKTIGFAPKKDNNRIYQRFKEGCDAFFSRKRAYYEQVKGEQNNNLQMKLDLCVQAESLSESTEWKKTTEEFINLQKRWKEIGPVPRKNSDELWKRFRVACDVFFNKKSGHFASIDSQQEENLKLKLELLQEMESFEKNDNEKETLNKLAEFQKRWAEIGHVPIKKKDEVQQRYRIAIKTHFDNIKGDENQRNMVNFKNKIGEISDKSNNRNKLGAERSKIAIRIREMENEIALYENNIGFFSKSSNADALIREVHNKIEKAKQNIIVLKEKLKIIDDTDVD